MTTDERIAVFKEQLILIDSPELRFFVAGCLTAAPEYFFHMPASTTGKYHPAYSLGEGGLVRHTQAAVKIANDLLSLEQNAHLDKDCIVAALILHDSVKKGWEDGAAYTAFHHPFYAADFVAKQANSRKYRSIISQTTTIRRLIQSHMGQWNTDRGMPNGALPKPEQEDEKFVHMCDYLASRKYLTCDLNMLKG